MAISFVNVRYCRPRINCLAFPQNKYSTVFNNSTSKYTRKNLKTAVLTNMIIPFCYNNTGLFITALLTTTEVGQYSNFHPQVNE